MKDPMSFSLSQKATAFLKLDALDSSPAYAKMAERLLEQSGLIDEDPETIFQMKIALHEFREWKRKTNNRKI